jgi:hypothetical protein
MCVHRFSSNIPRWRAMKDLLFLDEIPLQVRVLLYQSYTGSLFQPSDPSLFICN